MMTHKILKSGVLAVIIGTFCFASNATAQVLMSYTKPYKEVQLAISQPGTIYRLNVELGDRVTTDDVIAELDNRVLHASRKLAALRESSRAEIDAAKAGAELAKRRWQNIKLVHKNGHASVTEFESVRLESDRAQAELQLALEKIDEARVDIERIEAEIEQRIARSPIDGIVTQLPTDPGEYISSSEPSVATIVQIDKLRASFHLSTAQALQLTLGSRANLILTLSDQHQTIEAKIQYISSVTESDSDTVQVDVVIDNAKEKIRSGLPCEFVMPLTSFAKRKQTVR